MAHEQIRAQIEEILKATFTPSELLVVDDSHKHRNHKEAKQHPRAGHFQVRMVAVAFEGKSRVQRHRAVYDALASLMHSDVHALALDLKAPNEV